MRMQLFRKIFRKSCILLAQNWIKCFPGKNLVKSRKKIWIDQVEKNLLACL